MDGLIQVLAGESLPAPKSVSDDLALVSVKNDRVPSLWWRLRKSLSEYGWCPIIGGNPSDVERWLMANADEPKRALPEPTQAIFSKFLKQRRREMIEDIDDPDMAAELKVRRGELVVPEESIRGEFCALENMGANEPWPEVAMVFVRTDEAWKIPHVIPWGGFNEVPEPSELALTFWSWQQRFGAIPAAFTDDSIELFLQKPLTDPELIATAAEEMAVIAPDVVWQGVETTTALASEMANRNIWFMWWD